MKLIHVNPFIQFDALTRQMLRDTATNFAHGIDKGGLRYDKQSFNKHVFQPRTDVKETEQAFVLHLEIAGVKKEDVTINLDENRILTISGERKSEEKTEGTTYHRIERKFGSFVRNFQLPENINTSAIEAEFNDGVLTVTIPKAEVVQPEIQRIEIK